MQVSNTYVNTVNQRKVHRSGLTHVPSRPLFGLVLVVLLALSWTTVLTYGLFGWEWQQQLGRWNYYLAIGTSIAFALALRVWRNDPRRRFVGSESATGI